MVDENSLDLPSRVTDVLRIFLAATARGEKAELILETRIGRLTTKYRSSETVEGVPATSSTSTKKKKMNPARARRSRLRLEEFKVKKTDGQEDGCQQRAEGSQQQHPDASAGVERCEGNSSEKKTCQPHSPSGWCRETTR